MIQVLNNLPEAYDGTVELLEKDLEQDSLNINVLHEKLICQKQKSLEIFRRE